MDREQRNYGWSAAGPSIRLLGLSRPVLLLAMAIRAIAQSSYTATDLGTLGGTQSVAEAMNISGQVVGYSYLSGGQVYHAFLYSAGTMTDLGVISSTFATGPLFSQAFGINASGQAVGWSQSSASPGDQLAFLYSNGAMTNLGTLGGYYSHAYGINAGGQVVGWSDLLNSTDPKPHAFLYSGGTMSDLGTIGIGSAAVAINDGGQLVGTAASVGFLYSAGVVTNLGTLGGSMSTANAINSYGQVVGVASVNSTTAHAFLYKFGHMSDLGSLGGTMSIADSINVNGQVVGAAQTPVGAEHAFLYCGGPAVDLNNFVTISNGAVLIEAVAVNDSGQIAANGSDGHAYLLTPTAHAPAISSLSPSSATAGGPAFTLIVHGLDFQSGPGVCYVSGTTVEWNGVAVPTTFVSTTELTATISANLIATAGTATVTVLNAGGASSGTATFTINPVSAPPAPALISPANGATGVPLVPTLSWNASAGAPSYDVYFGNLSGQPLATNTTGVSYSPGTLSPGATYYWSVTANNSFGSTPSAVWYFTTANVSTVSIQTSPPGLQFNVDGGVAQTAPQTLNLTQGTHTIAVVATQPGATGTQYVFTGWSDSGAASHSITVGASTATYTAAFKTQYQLMTAALPNIEGAVSPATGQFYDSGTNVSVTATPASPNLFSSWSGGATGTSNPITVTMNGAQSMVGNFAGPISACELTGDAAPGVADVQLLLNEALGVALPMHDMTGDGAVNVADVQIEVSAVLGQGCFTR
jgi:probable HAF family extracellular repeat protein